MKNEIGFRLKELRLKNRITQARLAKLAGVSQSLISQVEKGEKPLPLRAFKQLTEELGIEGASIIHEINPANVIRELAHAWAAYEAARWEHYLLIERIQTLSRDFEKYWPKIREFLLAKGPLEQVIGPYQQIDLGRIDQLGTQTFRDQISSRLSPPAKEHPDYRTTLPGGMLPDQDRLHRVLVLAAECSKLSLDDINLLGLIANRLAQESTTRVYEHNLEGLQDDKGQKALEDPR